MTEDRGSGRGQDENHRGHREHRDRRAHRPGLDHGALRVEKDVVVVAGARGRFDRDRLLRALALVRDEHDVTLQAFDPGAIYGTAHAEAAARKALRAHREDRAIAKDLATEIACYAAGDPQISKALATVGVPLKGEALVLVAIGLAAEEAIEDALDRLGLQRADSVVQANPGTLERLGIGEAMRASVDESRWEALVLERVALLDAIK